MVGYEQDQFELINLNLGWWLAGAPVEQSTLGVAFMPTCVAGHAIRLGVRVRQ